MDGKVRSQSSTLTKTPTGPAQMGCAVASLPCSSSRNVKSLSKTLAGARPKGGTARLWIEGVDLSYRTRSKHIIWRVSKSLARYFFIPAEPAFHIGERGMFPECGSSRLKNLPPALGIAPWDHSGGTKVLSLEKCLPCGGAVRRIAWQRVEVSDHFWCSLQQVSRDVISQGDWAWSLKFRCLQFSSTDIHQIKARSRSPCLAAIAAACPWACGA